MRYSITSLVLLTTAPNLALGGIRQDIGGEPIKYRDHKWPDNFIANRSKCHETINYAATFYTGRDCQRGEETRGSPIVNFGCVGNCMPTQPIHSVFLEGLWWRRGKQLGPHPLLALDSSKVAKYNWEAGYKGIATEGPTIKLYSKGTCERGEENTFLGRAYIPEQQAFTCINFPQAVHSVRLEHLTICRRLMDGVPHLPRPTHINMLEASAQDIRNAYPNVDWDAYLKKKNKQNGVLEEELGSQGNDDTKSQNIDIIESDPYPERLDDLTDKQVDKILAALESYYEKLGGNVTKPAGHESNGERLRQLLEKQYETDKKNRQNAIAPTPVL